jgi:TDG/mug DNA glycosylase family protein
MNQINSFPPIANKDCTTLILGSMPGVESLRQNQYYAHPRNAFWRIMFELLGEETTEDYNRKTRMLLEHRIALWDVIHQCLRNGSLDSNIRCDEPNDFEMLFQDNPKIKRIFFNGAKAYETYRKKVGFDADKEYIRLPSTSPAHAVAFEQKLESWVVVVKDG